MSDATETGTTSPAIEPEEEFRESTATGPAARVNGQKQATPTPPPASVPSEFLEVQNPPVPAEESSSVTPPPASVPSEFLLEQEHRVLVVETPATRFQDYLDSGQTAPREFETGIWPLRDDALESSDSGTEEVTEPLQETLRLRGLPMIAGEEIASILLTDEGITDTMPRSGPALILTNRRLIAFRGVEGFRDTHVAAAEDISQYSVRTGQRNWGAVLQGFLMMVSGAFLYVVVAYWLAGQISGPNVPLINIDVAPLIALIIILAGLLVLLQNYFTRPAGAVIFRGSGVELAFPFRSALDIQQIYDFVDQVRSSSDEARRAA